MPVTTFPFSMCRYFGAYYFGSKFFTPGYFGEFLTLTLTESSGAIIRNPMRGIMVDINVGSSVAFTGTTLARRFGSITQPGAQTWDRQYDFWLDGLTQFGRRPPSADYIVYGHKIPPVSPVIEGGVVVEDGTSVSL